MDHTVESEASVVDNVVDLTESLDSTFNQTFRESLVEDITGDGDSLEASSINVSSNLIRLGYSDME